MQLLRRFAESSREPVAHGPGDFCCSHLFSLPLVRHRLGSGVEFWVGRGREEWAQRLRFGCITQPRHEVQLYNSRVFLVCRKARRKGFHGKKETKGFQDHFGFSEIFLGLVPLPSNIPIYRGLSPAVFKTINAGVNSGINCLIFFKDFASVRKFIEDHAHYTRNKFVNRIFNIVGY